MKLFFHGYARYKMFKHKAMITRVIGRAGERYEIPAYTNTGGTGDRTAIITASASIGMTGTASWMVDGLTTGEIYFNSGVTVVGKEVKWVFNGKKVINEFRWYTSTAGAQGTWQFQGSNNGVDWTNIGAAFTLERITAPPQVFTVASANTTGYSQYRILGTVGNIAVGGCYNREWEFKIGNLLP